MWFTWIRHCRITAITVTSHDRHGASDLRPLYGLFGNLSLASNYRHQSCAAIALYHGDQSVIGGSKDIWIKIISPVSEFLLVQWVMWNIWVLVHHHYDNFLAWLEVLRFYAELCFLSHILSMHKYAHFGMAQSTRINPAVPIVTNRIWHVADNNTSLAFPTAALFQTE